MEAVVQQYLETQMLEATGQNCKNLPQVRMHWRKYTTDADQSYTYLFRNKLHLFIG